MNGIFGLAAFGFWMFIAAAAVAGIWDGVRKREAEHETLRRMIEAGKQPDPETIDKLLGHKKEPARDLKVAGLIVSFVAPGLAVMGWFISFASEEALMPLLGVALLVAFVGAGLLTAAKFLERANARRRIGHQQHFQVRLVRYSADLLAKSPETVLVGLSRTGNRDAFAEIVRRRQTLDSQTLCVVAVATRHSLMTCRNRCSCRPGGLFVNCTMRSGWRPGSNAWRSIPGCSTSERMIPCAMPTSTVMRIRHSHQPPVSRWTSIGRWRPCRTMFDCASYLRITNA